MWGLGLARGVDPTNLPLTQKDPGSGIDTYLSYRSGGVYTCIKSCSLDVILVPTANKDPIGANLYCSKNDVQLLNVAANTIGTTSISVDAGDSISLRTATNSYGGCFTYIFIVG